MTRLPLPLLTLTLLFACPQPNDTAPDREVCDGIDNDGDGQVDEGFAFFVDNDGDGYGGESDDGCDGVSLSGDCDDTRDDVAPDGNEVCDGVDNDCDGDVDNDPVEGSPYWVDLDNDGYGGGDAMVLCERPDAVVEQGDDCDDDDSSVHPAAMDVFDFIDNDCDGTVDGDGTLCGIVPDPADARDCPLEQLLPPVVIVDSTAPLDPLYLGTDHEGDGCEFGGVSIDNNYASGDIVYALYVPPGVECTVALDDSCDSRMNAFIKRVSENCARDQWVHECEYFEGGQLSIHAAAFGRMFDIVVGASDGPGAPFKLTVSC